MNKLFMYALWCTFVVGVTPAIACAAPYDITSFDSAITIQPDGIVHVVENIEVQFNESRHGIYRDIPYVYEFTDGSKTYTTIDVQSVKDGARP